MDFKTRPQKAMYEQIREWLTAMVGPGLEVGGDGPWFGARNNSAFVQVSVAALNEQQTSVRVFAVVVRGAELDPTLLTWLLAQNREVPLGGFAVGRESEIMFLQNLLGSVCTRDLLAMAVQVVATVADSAGTAIVARWGGVRAFEDEAGAPEAESDSEGADADDEADAPQANAEQAPADAAGASAATPDASGSAGRRTRRSPRPATPRRAP